MGQENVSDQVRLSEEVQRELLERILRQIRNPQYSKTGKHRKQQGQKGCFGNKKKCN
jgi:hypothetical protein